MTQERRREQKRNEGKRAKDRFGRLKGVLFGDLVSRFSDLVLFNVLRRP
jgi:hypothetical protein